MFYKMVPNSVAMDGVSYPMDKVGCTTCCITERKKGPEEQAPNRVASYSIALERGKQSCACSSAIAESGRGYQSVGWEPVARDIATQGAKSQLCTVHRTTDVVVDLFCLAWRRTGELEPCEWRDDQRDCIRNREGKRPATRDGAQGSGRCQVFFGSPKLGNIQRPGLDAQRGGRPACVRFRWISTSATSLGTAGIPSRPRRGSEEGGKDVEQRVCHRFQLKVGISNCGVLTGGGYTARTGPPRVESMTDYDAAIHHQVQRSCFLVAGRSSGRQR